MITKIQDKFDKNKVLGVLARIAGQARATDANALYEHLPGGMPTLYLEIPNTGVVQIIPEGNGEIYARVPHRLTRDGIITEPLAEVSYAGFKEIERESAEWIGSLSKASVPFFQTLSSLLEVRGVADQMHVEPDVEPTF